MNGLQIRMLDFQTEPLPIKIAAGVLGAPFRDGMSDAETGHGHTFRFFENPKLIDASIWISETFVYFSRYSTVVSSIAGSSVQSP
jgi:hypothetical protein